MTRRDARAYAERIWADPFLHEYSYGHVELARQLANAFKREKFYRAAIKDMLPHLDEAEREYIKGTLDEWPED